MKGVKLLITFLLLKNLSFCQQNPQKNKVEIKKVLSTFMECLVKKDSAKFYNLFCKENIVWIGVMKQKSFTHALKNDSNAVDHFSDSYKVFYRNFYKNEIEEKFNNVQISEDGYIASVIFDYSFWFKNKKINWGKESWGLIKTNGHWKITSVLFSIEYEAINSEPKRKLLIKKLNNN